MLLAGAGCVPGAAVDDGVPRVDGRSDAAHATSLRHIKDGMSSGEQAAFADSVLRIVATLPLASASPEELVRRQRQRLHGMSVEEIHAAARSRPR